MIKKISAAVLIVFMFLSGCSTFDYKEPEKRSVVTALIISYNDGNYCISGEITGNNSEILTGNGENIEYAFKDFKENFNNEVLLYHCSVIICDKVVYLKSKTELFDFIYCTQQLSFAIQIVLSDDVKGFLSYKINYGNCFGNDLYEFLKFKNISSDFLSIARGTKLPVIVNIKNCNSFEISENTNV